MKKIIFALLIISVLGSCATSKKAAVAQAAYTVVPDKDAKVLKGYINRKVLENDSAFLWFAKNLKNGTPNAEAVQAFKTNAANFKMIVFGGTWCEDTQNLLPTFYQLVDKSGYPQTSITLVAVDRPKTAPDDLHKTYNVTNVPTFIVMKDGKEVGRVVEYGKSGKIDKELGEIVATAFAK